MLDDIKKRVSSLDRDYNSRLGQKNLLEKQLADEESELKSKAEYLDLWEQTNILLQKTSEYQRADACKQIEAIGTSALQFVMGSHFRLEVSMKDPGRRPEAEVYVVTSEDGAEIKTKPQDSRGGGIVDIVSIAMRIAMIQACDPPIDGPLLLDEPGKHVSAEYISLLSDFLQSISGQLGRQIIMVTHSEYMAQNADHKIKIVLQSGRSEVM